MELLLLCGTAFAIPFALAAALAPTQRRLTVIAALGVVLAIIVFGFGYVSAPTTNEPPCRYCSEFLGRWFNPGFTAFFLALGVAWWVAGAVLGQAARLVVTR